jgi:hypothetical protein
VTSDDESHCQRIEAEEPWPQILGSDVTLDEAHRVVAAFREVWQVQVLPVADEVARTLAPCMRSYRDYYVGRVSANDAAARVRNFGRVLWGSLEDHEWVWEVLFAGGSDLLPPSGSFGGFLAPDGSTLVIVHWPEG